MGFMRADYGTFGIAGQTTGTAISELSYILIKIDPILQQSHSEEEITSSAECKGWEMTVNRTCYLVLRPGPITAPGTPETG